jgi:hypothetical protein
MAELKSKNNKNCKLLEYAEDVAIYSVNRYSRICVSEVEMSIQNMELYLKESGLEIEPKQKKANCVSSIKEGQLMESRR